MNKPFWKNFDLVLEDYIEVDPMIGPPCVQIYIEGNGKI